MQNTGLNPTINSMISPKNGGQRENNGGLAASNKSSPQHENLFRSKRINTGMHEKAKPMDSNSLDTQYLGGNNENSQQTIGTLQHQHQNQMKAANLRFLSPYSIQTTSNIAGLTVNGNLITNLSNQKMNTVPQTTTNNPTSTTTIHSGPFINVFDRSTCGKPTQNIIAGANQSINITNIAVGLTNPGGIMLPQGQRNRSVRRSQFNLNTENSFSYTIDSQTIHPHTDTSKPQKQFNFSSSKGILAGVNPHPNSNHNQNNEFGSEQVIRKNVNSPPQKRTRLTINVPGNSASQGQSIEPVPKELNTPNANGTLYNPDSVKNSTGRNFSNQARLSQMLYTSTNNKNQKSRDYQNSSKDMSLNSHSFVSNDMSHDENQIKASYKTLTLNNSNILNSHHNHNNMNNNSNSINNNNSNNSIVNHPIIKTNYNNHTNNTNNSSETLSTHYNTKQNQKHLSALNNNNTITAPEQCSLKNNKNFSNESFTQTNNNNSLQMHLNTEGNEQNSITYQTNEYFEENPKPLEWDKIQLPLDPQTTLSFYGNYLTDYEKTEIAQYVNIYFIGHEANKPPISATPSDDLNNYGYDDDKGDYLYTLQDHIAYRYELIEPLGKGSFGQVIKAFDHKRNEFAAVQIIRNKKKFYHQAIIELQLLQFIRDNDPYNQTNIVKVKDFVIFRNHVVKKINFDKIQKLIFPASYIPIPLSNFQSLIFLQCIVFELLSINLYEFLKNNQFTGVSLELIRRFAIQILQGLLFLEKTQIIHCDLKPENILLKQKNKSGIKMVDFGSSCFQSERMYTYIQSRFYRAPQIILGLPYSMPIDMWSFGCILAELYMGYPIFPGENEQEQFLMFMEVLGIPDEQFVDQCPRKKIFFDTLTSPKIVPNSRGKIRTPGTKSLNYYMRCPDQQFIDLVQSCLTWEAGQRITPSEALVHDWIIDGLPEEIRIQHLYQMQQHSPHLNLREQFQRLNIPYPQPENSNSNTEIKMKNQKMKDTEHNIQQGSNQGKRNEQQPNSSKQKISGKQNHSSSNNSFSKRSDPQLSNNARNVVKMDRIDKYGGGSGGPGAHIKTQSSQPYISLSVPKKSDIYNTLDPPKTTTGNVAYNNFFGNEQKNNLKLSTKTNQSLLVPQVYPNSTKNNSISTFSSSGIPTGLPNSSNASVIAQQKNLGNSQSIKNSDFLNFTDFNSYQNQEVNNNIMKSSKETLQNTPNKNSMNAGKNLGFTSNTNSNSKNNNGSFREGKALAGNRNIKIKRNNSKTHKSMNLTTNDINQSGNLEQNIQGNSLQYE